MYPMYVRHVYDKMLIKASSPFAIATQLMLQHAVDSIWSVY